MSELINLQAILTGLLSTATVAACGLVFRQSRGVVQLVSANNAATKYLLKDRITQKCRYHLAEGFITPNDAEVLQEMFREYVNLGGNSYVHGLVERALALPPLKELQS